MTLSPAHLFLLLPFLYLAAVSLPLTIIDLKQHRLPNKLVLPGYLVMLAGLLGYVTFSLLTQRGNEVWVFAGEVLLCAAGYFGFLFLLSYLGGMGMGDVKLAGVLGGTAAMLSLAAAVCSVLLAFVIGGLVSLVVLAVRRKRGIRIPFGPFMLVGFWISAGFAVLVPLLNQASPIA